MDLFSVVILQGTSLTEHLIAHCLLAGLFYQGMTSAVNWWSGKAKGGIVSSPVAYLKRPAYEIVDRQSGGHMQCTDNTDPVKDEFKSFQSNKLLTGAEVVVSQCRVLLPKSWQGGAQREEEGNHYLQGYPLLISQDSAHVPPPPCTTSSSNHCHTRSS